MKKPVRLEFNNSGAWKVLGRFDAADEVAADHVLDAADSLFWGLNEGRRRRASTLRVSTDDGLGIVLMRWDIESRWHDAKTGEPT
jgi:hypothetical protein